MSVYVHPLVRLRVPSSSESFGSATATGDVVRPGVLGRAPGDGGVIVVIRGGSGVDQTNHGLLRRMLLAVLVAGAQAGPRAPGGIGSVPLRACAALWELLGEHPVDQWGRCRSCRWPGSVFGPRWQSCRVYYKADLCLRQLDEVLLLSPLIEELGLDAVLPPTSPGSARW
ncbi:MAG: hypothetical protein ACRDQ4_27735 [Pseudonocardiaceae bacterium]